MKEKTILKASFTFLMLLFLSFTSAAQQQETVDPTTKKFYVGVSFNTSSYYMKYTTTQPGERDVPIIYMTYPTVHLGYKLNKIMSIQIGAGYANKRDHDGWIKYNSNGNVEGNFDTIKTKGFIIPVTFRTNFVNIKDRFQVFGTASLTTAFGKSTLENTETTDDVVTNRYKINKSAVNAFLLIGLGANYQISDRFSAFGEYIMLNKNLNYDYQAPDKHKFNIGLNYRL